MAKENEDFEPIGWDELEAAIRNCRKCQGLNIRGSTQSAPGYGNKESPIVLIGQSLCQACMSTQIPFTGGSGLILDEIFKRSLAKKKSNLFTTNLVKCHPPRNRASKTEEKNACVPFLIKEIEYLNPTLVIPLGADATSAFLGRVKISDFVHQKYWNGTFTVVPMYHPSYIMRGASKLILSAYIRRFVELIDYYWERIEL